MTATEERLRKEARQRVEKVLNGLWRSVGPLDRELLGAMLDGAQEAVAEWLPEEWKREPWNGEWAPSAPDGF